jgi:hypothetical protein
MNYFEEKCEELADLISQSQHTVAITGAGWYWSL